MELEFLINEAWENPEEILPQARGPKVEAIYQILKDLDQGERRVVEKKEGKWLVHQWIKKAIVLSFRLYENDFQTLHGLHYDKIPLKFKSWSSLTFKKASFRVVPGAIVRYSAYIATDAILMPSFINVGTYVGHKTMIDTWSTLGACAQVGDRCHISGGVGLGGVLEPLQSNPVIIEDDCFIGARSEVVEGVIVEEGCVIGMGVFIGASTPIVDRSTGEIYYGRVPAYSVVIAGSMPCLKSKDILPGLALNCAIIVKKVDAKTRSKTSINELLRA